MFKPTTAYKAHNHLQQHTRQAMQTQHVKHIQKPETKHTKLTTTYNNLQKPTTIYKTQQQLTTPYKNIQQPITTYLTAYQNKPPYKHLHKHTRTCENMYTIIYKTHNQTYKHI